MKIIAECGVNYDDLDQALRMVGYSNWAGADYAKFQLYDSETIKDHPLRDELAKRMLSREDAQELVDCGKKAKAPVFFTPMFLDAIEWIAEMGCHLIKIRYADRYNTELVNRAREVGVPVLISADRDFMDLYLDCHTHTKFLYCVSRYPADPRDYVLTPIDFSAHRFAGVSDHTDQGDFEVMDRALKCGAAFCEVHVKLDDSHPIEERWSKNFSDLREWIANRLC